MPTADLAQIDRDITQIIEPPGVALAQARQTVHSERTSLDEVRQDLQERLAKIEQRITTLVELDAKLEALQQSESNGQGETASPAAPAPKEASPKRKRATKTKTASTSTPAAAEPSMSNLISSALKDAGKALSTDELAERIKKNTGVEVDRRGMAGALTGGVRAGRLTKTRAGRYKAAS